MASIKVSLLLMYNGNQETISTSYVKWSFYWLYSCVLELPWWNKMMKWTWLEISYYWLLVLLLLSLVYYVLGKKRYQLNTS